MASSDPSRLGVSAVILSYNRGAVIGGVLDRVLALSVDEVIVVDNGSADDSLEVVAGYAPRVRLIESGGNFGAPARNIGAEAATGDLLLFLDDDSYPMPGAIESLAPMFRAMPQLGAVGGLVRDIGPEAQVLRDTELGTFDWFLRAGFRGEVPPEGLPTFFFPEGACLVRRAAFLEVGGFYGPYFFTASEVDVSTRLLQAGWDVRYQPAAVFHHLKATAGRVPGAGVMRYRVRNQLWYCWLRFPIDKAIVRMAGYLVFDFVEAAYRGALASWAGGIADAWRQRDQIRGDRNPVPRQLVARVECGRGRLHVRLLVRQLLRRLPGVGRQPVEAAGSSVC